MVGTPPLAGCSPLLRGRYMKIAFDIDDTLIVPSVVTGLGYETPNYENIAIFRWFQAQGYAARRRNCILASQSKPFTSIRRSI